MSEQPHAEAGVPLYSEEFVDSLVILVFLLEVCWGLLEVMFVQDLDSLQKIQKHRKPATTHFIHEVVARFLTKCVSIDCWSCVDFCIAKWICQLYLVALGVQPHFETAKKMIWLLVNCRCLKLPEWQPKWWGDVRPLQSFAAEVSGCARASWGVCGWNRLRWSR